MNLSSVKEEATNVSERTFKPKGAFDAQNIVFWLNIHHEDDEVNPTWEN